MRVVTHERERTRKQFIKKKKHFHWVPHIEEEVILLLESSLDLKFEHQNQVTRLRVGEVA